MPKGDVSTVFHAHVTCQGHENGGDEMADTQKLLSRNPAVGHDAHQSGHKKGNDTLDGKEFADVGTHANAAKINAQRTKISSPHRKDEEVHHNKSEFDCFHICCFNCLVFQIVLLLASGYWPLAVLYSSRHCGPSFRENGTQSPTGCDCQKPEASSQKRYHFLLLISSLISAAFW